MNSGSSRSSAIRTSIWLNAVHERAPADVAGDRRVKAAFGNAVYVQSKIYPKNSYKIFKFCPTKTRTINPVGHGSFCQ